MPRSMVIRNIDDQVFAQIRLRAARNGRSMEAEVREILKLAAAGEPGRADLRERLDAFRDSLGGRRFTPAEALVRDGRDQR